MKNPKENVVCKCEKVTEYEIVDALHRSLPVDSTQSIRRRTRAGMGHCQGDKENYDCECRVAEIISRELKLPGEAVGRRPWPATSSLPGYIFYSVKYFYYFLCYILLERWLNDEQKAVIESYEVDNN